MSNVVTGSALTCKYFITIVYNPFRRILHQPRDGMTASRGAVTRSQNSICMSISLTENPVKKMASTVPWTSRRRREKKAKIGFAVDAMTVEDRNTGSV